MPAPFPRPLLQRARRLPCRAVAGFTLVELMVAMTGGLFLTIVVFALSRDASRFYQRESRVANATLAGLSGFERLSADVARAGHLSTPNMQTDPRVCNRPATGTLPGDLRALVVQSGVTDVAGTELPTAGISPQTITVAGALNAPEVLISSAIDNATGPWQITLNLNTPAAKRLGLEIGKNNAPVMTALFMAGGQGRIVRLRANGWDQYGVVSNVAGPLGGDAVVTLAAAPALQRLVSGGEQCGIDNLGTGYAISIIDVVRYSIRSMVANTDYKALFDASFGSGGGPALPYEAKRAELVRDELGVDGVTPIPGTREIVGEYAVDLQVNAWSATDAINPALTPVADLTTYPSTQLLRGVHLRFSVRSREADREGPIAGETGNDHYRIGLGASGGAPYARVRTFQSDIPLRNLEGR